jgi:hypothetical protein
LESTGGWYVPEIDLDLAYFPAGAQHASDYVPSIRVLMYDREGQAPSMAFVPVVE